MQETNKRVTVVSKESPKSKTKQFLFRVVMVIDQLNRIEKEIEAMKSTDTKIYKQSKKIWISHLKIMEKRLKHIKSDLEKFIIVLTDADLSAKANEYMQMTNDGIEKVTECMHKLSSV